MSVSVTVSIPPEISLELAKLREVRKAVVEGAAAGVEVALREHFRYLQSRPRADGLKPVGFWDGTDGNSVAEQIGDPRLSGDSVVIEIDSAPLRHRIDGGDITASDYGHPYLTIPATDAAAAAPQGARSFETHIQWVPHPDGGVRPALVSGPKGSDGVTLFWLVRHVKHLPMPEALPLQSDLDAAARDAALDVIDAILSQPGEAA
jgi:hypothetical protein